MKHPCISALTAIAVVFIFSSYRSDSRINLYQALQNKYITVDIRGLEPSKRPSGTSSHYGQCMDMSITNLTNRELNLHLETGRYFDSKDPSVQDMIVTKETVVKVPAKQKRSYKIYAMCGQKSNAAPSYTQSFKIGKMSKGNILGLAKLIEKKSYQNYTAQNAVWSLTDNASIDNISSSGNDHNMKKELVSFVCRAKNIPIPKEYGQATISVKVSFRYTLEEDARVSIRLYRTDGTYVKDILPEQLQKKGSVNESYWITDADVPKGKYYAQLYIDGSPGTVVAVEL